MHRLHRLRKNYILAAFLIPISIGIESLRNPSSIETQEKRDCSARNAPRNDGNFLYSAPFLKRGWFSVEARWNLKMTG